jgi:hypothetical protein
MVSDAKADNGEKVWIWLWRFTSVAVIPWAAFATMWAFSVSERLTRIEESAIRSSEASMIWRKLDVIQERLDNHVDNCEKMVAAIEEER